MKDDLREKLLDFAGAYTSKPELATKLEKALHKLKYLQTLYDLAMDEQESICVRHSAAWIYGAIVPLEKGWESNPLLNHPSATIRDGIVSGAWSLERASLLAHYLADSDPDTREDARQYLEGCGESFK